jgi:hypothetical protein
LGARYLEEYARPHKKPSAFAQDLRNLQNHIVPLIGTLRASEIERQDIARVMRDIARGKTAKDEKTKIQGRRIVRGGQIVANRVHALLSKCSSWLRIGNSEPPAQIPAEPPNASNDTYLWRSSRAWEAH